MSVNCDPSSLANEARCFDRCIPPGMQPAVETYLLASIAGVGTDAASIRQLVNDARCFARCGAGTNGVKTYLLCQIADS